MEILTPKPDLLQDLLTIETECFNHPLTAEQLERLLRDPATLFLAAREGETLLGSVWVQTVLDEGYIGNVAVRPAFRHRGVADALLDALDTRASERGLAFLTLEVRAGNEPAIALYRKHGYLRVGLRPGYYADPREDAILMTKEKP